MWAIIDMYSLEYISIRYTRKLVMKYLNLLAEICWNKEIAEAW